jgi:hypothetical protein
VGGGGLGGAGRRLLDRGLYRRAPAEGGGEGVRGRCRDQPARLEAAPGPAGGRPREDQRPLSHRRGGDRARRSHRVRLELHLARQGARLRARPREAGRPADRTHQAAVRGRARRDRQGRGGEGPGGAGPGLRIGRRLGALARVECRGYRPKPDHRPRGQCRIPSCGPPGG